MTIDKKIVLITGASSGIGLATAQLLGQKGATVILVARSKDKLDTISAQLPNSLPIACDVTVANDVKEMIDSIMKKYGRIDVLVNNAGRGYDSSIEDIDLDKFRDLIELNVVAPLSLTQKIIPIMRNQNEGKIVFISSGTTFMSIPYIGAYSSSKRALNGLALTAREELASANISVSVVYPYITNTDFHSNKMTKSDRPGSGEAYQQGDSPELVAQKILLAIGSNEAEVFVRESIKK